MRQGQVSGSTSHQGVPVASRSHSQHEAEDVTMASYPAKVSTKVHTTGGRIVGRSDGRPRRGPRSGLAYPDPCPLADHT